MMAKWCVQNAVLVIKSVNIKSKDPLSEIPKTVRATHKTNYNLIISNCLIIHVHSISISATRKIIFKCWQTAFGGVAT